MRLHAGSGLFSGLQFAPLVPQLVEQGFLVRDFTRGLSNQPALAESGFKFDVGRYNERRRSMYTSDLFGSKDPWAAGNSQRDIHIGLDVGGPVGTAVHAFSDGVVHACGYNAAELDYGHVIVTKHLLNGLPVWALYGHLSAASIAGKAPGLEIKRGDVVGWLGDVHENGGWPAHVHFQLSLTEPETHDMPGVVSAEQHLDALRDYPDPRTVLGALYQGDGLFETLDIDDYEAASESRPRGWSLASPGAAPDEAGAQHQRTSAQSDGDDQSDHDSSAVSIQKKLRGVLAKRTAAALRAKRRARSEDLSGLATRIQALSRRQQAARRLLRLELDRRSDAAVRLQTQGRRAAAVRAAALRRDAHGADARRREGEARAAQEQDGVVTVRLPRATNSGERRGRLAALLRRTGSGSTSPAVDPAPPPSQPAPADAARPPVVESELPTAQVAAIEERALLASVGRVDSYRSERDGSMSGLPVAFACSLITEATQPANSAVVHLPDRTMEEPHTPPPPPPAAARAGASSADVDDVVPRSPQAARRPPPLPSAPPPPTALEDADVGLAAGALTEDRVATISELASNSATPEQRRGALALLAGEFRNAARAPEGAAPICALLALVRPLYDEDTNVRVAAVRCAQRLGSLELAQFALDDEAAPVRRAVVEALCDADAASGANGIVRRPEDQRLVTLIVSLMKALEDVTLDVEILVKGARRLRDALLRTGVRRSPGLLAAPLEKGMQAQRSETVRIALVVAAGEMRAVDSLTKIAIFDAAPAVRRAAVEVLGWNEAADELRELVLAGDDDARVRADALEWLERLDDADGLAARGLLGDKSAELRARAATHLGAVAARRVAGCAPARRRGTALPCAAPPPLTSVADFVVPPGHAALREPWYGAVTEALGRALTSDGNVGVRGAAATQLARLRSVHWLANGLRDVHTQLRQKCVELLGDLGPDAVDALEVALHDADAAVRHATIERLGRLGDPHLRIDATATRDAEERNRLFAVGWLAKLRRPATLAQQCLVDASSAAVRAAAAEALEKLFTEVNARPAAEDSGGAIELAAATTACRAALLVRLGDTERRVRVAAALALAAVGEPAWKDVLRGDSGDCARLGRLKGPKGTAVLVSVLCDASELSDRIAAADALATLREAPRLAIEALCACCAARVLPAALRVAALKALQALAATAPDDAQLDAALRASFGDAESEGVRVAAAHCAGACRAAGAHALEHGLLKHVRPAKEASALVRAACAARLSHFGPASRAAGLALLDALRDRDVATRDAAAASLSAFQRSDFTADLAQRAAAYLTQTQKKTYLDGDDYLPHGSPVTRAAAARALGALRSATALDALHDALARDKEPLVRRALCHALGEVQHPKSLKPLLGPLRDKKNLAVVEAARDAVARLDYSLLNCLQRGEAVLKHAPIFKSKQRLWTSLKALVLTDAPRLFYVDADTLKAKSCDVHTLVVDADNAAATTATTRDLAFHVPGQGRVRVTLLYGAATDWLAARGQAVAYRNHLDGEARVQLDRAAAPAATSPHDARHSVRIIATPASPAAAQRSPPRTPVDKSHPASAAPSPTAAAATPAAAPSSTAAAAAPTAAPPAVEKSASPVPPPPTAPPPPHMLRAAAAASPSPPPAAARQLAASPAAAASQLAASPSPVRVRPTSQWN
ncbi:armadillo-type protein [Pelagophyceae sp. CCMP2097]|nr:armadillo-type protein [Pelagophyceae sp. CCMP2097]